MNTFKEGPGDLGSTGFGERASYPDKNRGVPAPGGGEFVGPGGQAPAFAPGGPEDPESPAITYEYFEVRDPAAFQPGFIGSGAIGDPAKAPQEMGYPTSQPTVATPGFYPTSLAAIGGAGAASSAQISQQNPGLPGHGNTPGRFQPGGGVSLPQPGQLPTQRPGRQEQGFLAHIIHMEGDVSRIIPVTGQPGQPLPPTQPGVPGQPLPPTNPFPPGVGGGPVLPPGVTEPGFPTPPIVIPPWEGGGPTSGKPKGLKTLPMPKDKVPPEGPPKPPGQWVTLDAGRGQPPAYAFIEDSSTGGDSGLTPEPKKGGASTLPTRPGAGEKGHYVPVQLPATVQPVSAEDEMVWAWVPTIDHTYGVKEEEPPKPQPK